MGEKSHTLTYSQMATILKFLKELMVNGQVDKAITEIDKCIDHIDQCYEAGLFKIEATTEGLKVFMKPDFIEMLNSRGVFDDFEYSLKKASGELCDAIQILGKRLQGDGMVYIYKHHEEKGQKDE